MNNTKSKPQHTPQHRSLWEGLLDFPCNTNVSEQHELLDQAVGLSQLLLLDIDRIGRFRTIEMDFDFRRGEIQCASVHSLLLQLLSEGIQKTNAPRELVLPVSEKI